MSDLFQQALAETLPLLQSMKNGVKPAPKASRSSLEKLAAASISRPAPASTAPAATQTAITTPASWTWPELEKAILSCQD